MAQISADRHIRVTMYVESWSGHHVTSVSPGIFAYTYLVQMLGRRFVEECLSQGSMVMLPVEA
jgi:hypothetical protein